jgi:hypothetical protein
MSVIIWHISIQKLECIGTISVLQGRHLFPQERKGEWGKLNFSPKVLFKYISSMGFEAYNTLATAVQILLAAPVSGSSCERSFSRMKLTKSYLHCTVSQDRFTNLAILSVKNEVPSSINFSDVNKVFVVVYDNRCHQITFLKMIVIF